MNPVFQSSLRVALGLAVGALGAGLQAQDAPPTGNPVKAPPEVKAEASVPNAWFKETRRDLGTFLEGETAVGKFPFKNPRDETHRLSHISPNCQCAKARIVVGDRVYRVENEPKPQTIFRIDTDDAGAEEKTRVKHIAVAAGEEGYVEIHLNLKNIKGKKDAYVAMRTSDPILPTMTVTASARGVQLFKVVPPEVNLNKMTWAEKREFSFEVSSEVVDNFEIVGQETTGESLVVEAPTKTMRDGKAVWQFKGSYGPDADPKSGGGLVKLKVELDGEEGVKQSGLDVRVIAMVDGPMTVRPGTFLPLGRIKAKEGMVKVVEFEPNDDFDLQIVNVELSNLSVDRKWVTVEAKKDGKVCKVELKVAAGAPRRLIRGDIKVKLNHPAIPQKELQFNGFVR